MFRSLGKLALPLIIGQLCFASMGFIDTILMGKLGVLVLAGGGLGAVVFQFFNIVGIGVLVATANLIAFAKGKGRDDDIHSSVLSGAVLVVLLAVSFGILALYSGPVLRFLEQPAELLPIAQSYLNVVVWAFLPAFIFILLRSLALGLGNTSAVLPISILAAVANYPISYVLMTGKFGLPALGVQGVALGTVIVSWFMALGMMWMLYRDAQFAPFKFWKQWQQFSRKNLSDNLRLGIPIAIAHAVEVGMFSAAALLIGTLGAEALAAHQVVLQCATMSFMIPLGLGQAVSVRVGECYGARDFVKLKRVVKTGMLMATATASVAGCVFWVFPDVLVGLFLTTDSSENYQRVLTLAGSMLIVGALFQLVDSWQVVLMGILRGFKLGTAPTVAATISYWVVGFPAAYFLMDVWQGVGVWSGLGIGLAFSALTLAGIFFRTMRKELA
jgi:MATE family multidrug resistance protein